MPGDFALLIVLQLVTLWFGREAIFDIINRGWKGSDSTYVLFAPLLVAFLFWTRRSRFQSVRYEPTLFGPLIVLAGLSISAFGFDRDVILFWQAGVLISMVGAVISMTGFRILKLFGAAFFALFMFLPIPGSIRDQAALPLQSLATGITSGILELFMVDAVRQGNMLLISGELVAVGEACNGMPMIMGVGMIVYAFVFSVRLSFRKTVLILASSPFIALFCNVLRLLPTSLAYGFTNPEFAGWVYALGGWLMLPATVVILFLLVSFLFAEETFIDRFAVE